MLQTKVVWTKNPKSIDHGIDAFIIRIHDGKTRRQMFRCNFHEIEEYYLPMKSVLSSIVDRQILNQKHRGERWAEGEKSN